MNKTRIDWPWKPLLTWNPVVGCKHGCSYCYAKKMSDRFKMISDWTKPQVFPGRMADPLKEGKSKNIFVGSMCDLFGDWVPSSVINRILDVAYNCGQHQFLFLTKNPSRYKEFEFPRNCWLGATITKMEDFIGYYEHGGITNKNKCFLSIEPLLGGFSPIIEFGFDKIIVGAMTGPGAVKPTREWIESIKHSNIYYKQSIRDLYPEFRNKKL